MALRMTNTLREDNHKNINFSDSLQIWRESIQHCTEKNDGINKPEIIEQPELTDVPDIISQCVYHHTICNNVSPMYTFMLMIGAMNCATRGYFKVDNGNFPIPANAFVAQSAESGYGKSHTTKFFKTSIIEFKNEYNDSIRHTLDRERHERKRISLQIKDIEKKDIKNTNLIKREKYMSQIEELKIESEKFKLYELEIFADDITVPALMELMFIQRERIAIMNSELGILRYLTTAKSSSNYCEKLLRLFNGDDIKFDRKSGEKVVMHNPILALYIATQIESLRDLLSNQYIIDSGTSSRLLVTIADDRNVGFRNFDKVEGLPNAQKIYNSNIHKVLHRIQSSNLQNETLFFDNFAQQKFQETRYEIEIELRNGGYLSSISEWAKKLCNHISSIAAFIHLYKYPERNNTISHKTLKTATDVAHWLALNMISFNNYAFPTRSKEFPFIIGKHIYEKNINFFRPRDIRRLFNYISIEDIKYGLSTLTSYGALTMITEPNRTGPGRPSGQLYAVNRHYLLATLDNFYYR